MRTCPTIFILFSRSIQRMPWHRDIGAYLKDTVLITQAGSLFVLSSEPRIGTPFIQVHHHMMDKKSRAYHLKDKSPPELLRVYSTRGPWVFGGQTSVALLFKAATLSSAHTFSKFYQVDAQLFADAAFSRRVLTKVLWSCISLILAAVWPVGTILFA